MINSDEKIVNEPPNFPLPLIKIPTLIPQSLKKKEENNKFKKFLGKFRNLSINITLLEALQEIPGFAKFMNNLVS